MSKLNQIEKTLREDPRIITLERKVSLDISNTSHRNTQFEDVERSRGYSKLWITFYTALKNGIYTANKLNEIMKELFPGMYYKEFYETSEILKFGDAHIIERCGISRVSIDFDKSIDGLPIKVDDFDIINSHIKVNIYPDTNLAHSKYKGAFYAERHYPSEVKIRNILL